MAARDCDMPGRSGRRRRLRKRTLVSSPPNAARARAAPVQRRRRRVHVRYDSASRPGRDHGRLGAFARRAPRRPGPLRAHRRRTARRDCHHADLAPRSRPAGSRRDVDAPQDDDERHDTRDADAGDVDRRGNGRTGSRARGGIRPALPPRHDQASPGRDRHGRRALQVVRRGAGRDHLQVRVGRVRGSVDRDQSDERNAGKPPMTKMRLLLVNGLLATALFAAGAFGVPACASSGKKTSPPATTSGAPPAVSPPAPKGRTLGATHSDLAFSGNLVIQGNYNGFDIYDISNPSKPVLMQTYLCPASQNDVSVYRNLLFMSSEAINSRADCGFEGVPEPVSKLRVRGIRVFDISDVKRPKLVTTVQTCRGSHTHTVVTKQGDDANVFIYVSGTAGVRSADEVPGCTDGGVDDPNTARFRLEVIKVPLRAPVTAAIVSSPRIFQGLPGPPRSEERDAQDRRDREAAAAAAAARGERGRGGAAGAAGGQGRGNQGPPTGPNQCHDITVYPEIGLAGGACAGLGLLLDIHDPEHP